MAKGKHQTSNGIPMGWLPRSPTASTSGCGSGVTSSPPARPPKRGDWAGTVHEFLRCYNVESRRLLLCVIAEQVSYSDISLRDLH